MKITVSVNHNFHEERSYSENDFFKANKQKVSKNDVKTLFSTPFELSLSAESLKHIELFRLNNKPFSEFDDKQLILKLYTKEVNSSESAKTEHEYYIQTGLFVGVVYYKNCEFNITFRMSPENSLREKILLERMLSFFNNIYIDHTELDAQKNNDTIDFWWIIAHLFIESLRKATVLGLPIEYQEHKESSTKVKGKIDFTQHIKKDIPFQGKLSVQYKKQDYVQEIIDVLYFALEDLNKKKSFNTKQLLSNTMLTLKKHQSGQRPTSQTLHKAKSHRSLNNPAFSHFKKILAYAEIILNQNNLNLNSKAQNPLEAKGYLLDISELFELYLTKLLQRHFPNWRINGQEEMKIYQDSFFRRSFYPDIVMRRNDTEKVAVFDAKFKKMKFENNEEVSREDLHQIHSYAGYYGDQLVASGLLYYTTKNELKQSTLYGTSQHNSTFLISGICIEKISSREDLLKNEQEFIEHIRGVIEREI